VVDQNGNLLSEAGKQNNGNGLDPSQLKYVQELQQSIIKRIESIVTPIVGPENVRAEATADVDFSHVEQAAETYTPNQTPNASAIRSQQSSETQSGSPTTAAGVPGALSNQPPAPATAPLTAPAGTTPGATAATAATSTNSHKDMTVNYEVDKTVKYVQQPMGGLKRLSVAVVVNYRKVVGKDGKSTMKPLSDAEKTQITELVKEAMGYSKERGDSLEVVNSPFASAEKETIPETPVWKRPDVLQTAMGAGKYVIGGAILAYLFFGVLRPMLRKIGKSFEPPAPIEDDTVVHLSHETEPMGSKPRTYQDNLDAAKQLAKSDPKMVANVVKAWVGTNE
jgi:flagellar M-ring protein FliF